jgi:demethylmenaquinone methyltransferase/2-methoxy-6-polyprenyl-1,4-benzoquinol methylase
LLDLGAGTGDLGREARRQNPACQAIAADFTLEMMRVGRQNLLTTPQAQAERLEWSGADALHLPFPDGFFDAVVSGFLLRNVTDLSRSLAEQFRVLKPGGRIVALDTTPPPRSVLTPLIDFHLHTIIPTVGRILTGQSDAYQYLPDTTQNFLPPQQLAARLMAAGFSSIGYQRRMFGTIAIYWGTKPDPGANNR